RPGPGHPTADTGPLMCNDAAHTHALEGTSLSDAAATTLPIPDPGVPAAQARSGPLRWGAVAIGCAALVAGSIAAAPSVRPAGTAPVAAAGTPKAVPTAAAPDARKAQLPLDCGPLPSTVSVSFAADLGDGTPATIAAAHCQAGSGTAPDGVFIVTAGPDGTPTVHDTLVDWREGLTVTALALRSDGTLTAKAQGYSTPDVPRCCPDLTVQLSWAHHGTTWSRTQQSTPTSST
ncbi:hypothetical protein ACFW1A_36960, partial [Kitasatospora sp. NPDC058965]|uniref:hypothetical protein n=1 Tax=Kitasatospora sp. NPDC058965 TaxID=3346682 RepID=UPI0036A30AB0